MVQYLSSFIGRMSGGESEVVEEHWCWRATYLILDSPSYPPKGCDVMSRVLMWFVSLLLSWTKGARHAACSWMDPWRLRCRDPTQISPRVREGWLARLAGSAGWLGWVFRANEAVPTGAFLSSLISCGFLSAV